jgi:hypothetical protein
MTLILRNHEELPQVRLSSKSLDAPMTCWICLTTRQLTNIGSLPDDDEVLTNIGSLPNDNKVLTNIGSLPNNDGVLTNIGSLPE